MLNIFHILAAANTCSSSSFFGLRTWWYYLPQGDFSSDCKSIDHFQLLKSSQIPLVGLAIVDDLLRIAGIVAVAFVIYGGIQYIASQGNPDNTSRAQSTILNALIGLAVAIVATAFVTYLGDKLGG